VNKDFRELLFVLCDEEVEYLVVGAYAMASHGLPRSTGDLDLWVRASDGNAQRIWKALLRFGAPLGSMSLGDFQTPDIVFRMGFPPSQIDILSGISGINFDEAWPNRIQAQIEGIEVYVISPADLIRNKRAANRPKDLVDADLLEKRFPSS
jgi:hypothetical protein